jgi:chorismate synthase
VDLLTLKPSVTKYERSDTCVVPAASVIGRAVLAIEVCKVFQEKFGGDSMDEVKRTFRNYLKYVEERYSR